MRAASIKLFYAAHKEDLKRRHERRSAGAIKDFHNAHVRKIKIVQAEVAQVSGNKMLQQRLAALVAKENFITDQDIRRAKLASGNFRGKFLRWSKAANGH